MPVEIKLNHPAILKHIYFSSWVLFFTVIMMNKEIIIIIRINYSHFLLFRVRRLITVLGAVINTRPLWLCNQTLVFFLFSFSVLQWKHIIILRCSWRNCWDSFYCSSLLSYLLFTTFKWIHKYWTSKYSLNFKYTDIPNVLTYLPIYIFISIYYDI